MMKDNAVFAAAMAATSLVALASPATANEPDLRPLNGFYAGVFAGAIALDSTVSFAATDTRPAERYVDQGGDGFVVGLRGGWGQLISVHKYLGIEIEGLVPWNVTSRLNANGAEYRARLRSELGIYGRAGWSRDGQDLLFIRAGFTIPKQTYESVENHGTGTADWTPVPTIGAGAEIAISRRWAGRVDISYSFPHGDNVLESYRLTFGVSYRF
ncbi:porin family protein [Roseomonas sp. JC162]|uniref:Porin family protein n=1 Tax=Neoroseomonas marina TaxID=1232220 RepID=A0A848EFU6_9PROT|nr:outer membrane beta-barrel protein [Neoroseomonas marina]NMJ42459.1 porin family protein [Neoroseomonas marina]